MGTYVQGTYSASGKKESNTILTDARPSLNRKVGNEDVIPDELEKSLRSLKPFGDSFDLAVELVDLCHEWVGESASSFERLKSQVSAGFSELMAEPLKYPACNTPSRNLVSQANRQDIDVISVIRLADELCLDEVMALDLWRYANSVTKNKRRRNRSVAFIERDLGLEIGESTYEVSVYCFFAKRRATLDILRKLLEMRGSAADQNDQSKLAQARGLSDSFLAPDFVMKLFACIESLNQRIAQLLLPVNRGLTCLSIQLEFLRYERRQLASCLFILYHETFAEGEEILKLIELLRSMSEMLLDAQDDDLHQRELTSLYETIYVLLMALGSALDRGSQLYDRHEKRECTKPFLSSDRSLLMRIDEELYPGNSSQSTDQLGGLSPEISSSMSFALTTGGASQPLWRHDGILGACLLLWCATLFDLRPSDFPHVALASRRSVHHRLNLGLERRGIAFFRGVVRSPEFIQDDLRPLYIGILDELTAKLVAIRGHADRLADATSDRISTRENPVEEVLSLRIHLAEGQQQAVQQTGSYRKISRSSDHGGIPQGYDMVGQNISGNILVPDSRALPDSLEDFLGLLQALHALEPELADKYWRENTIFNQFLRQISIAARQMSTDPYSFYVSFLGFLASLGYGEENSRHLSRYLCSSTDGIGWSTLFQALRHFSGDLLNSPAGRPVDVGANLVSMHSFESNPSITQQLQLQRSIPEGDQLVLCCWLRIFNSAMSSTASVIDFLRSNESQVASDSMQLQGLSSGFINTATTENDASACVGLFFSLLKFNLEPALKAQLIKAIEKLVAYSAQLVFENLGVDSRRMEHSNMPSQQRFSGANHYGYLLPEIVKRDLDQKESVMHAYPATISFLDLVLVALKICPQDKNHVFLPVIQIVLNEIFLKVDQRKYRVFGERWKIILGCMQIFVYIIDGYTKDSAAAAMDFGQADTSAEGSFSAGFCLLSKVFEGAQLYRQLMKVLEDAGGAAGVRNAINGAGVEKVSLSSHHGLAPWLEDEGRGYSRTAKLAHWFVVASRRSNLDIRNSSALIHDQVVESVNHGMIRLKSHSNSPSNPFFDNGFFSSWLALPFTDGWLKSIPIPANSMFFRKNQSDQGVGKPTAYGIHNWDDGDIGGRWREKAVGSTLNFLEICSERENWFFHGIHRSDLALENRLERLHRLFSHKCERLAIVAGFFSFPFSDKLRLSAIKLIFRLSQQAVPGSVAQALSGQWRMMATSLSECLMGSLLVEQDVSDYPANQLVTTNCEQYIPVPIDIKSERSAAIEMPKTILKLLIGTFSLPRGNLADLILGLSDISNGTGSIDSVDLVEGPSVLTAILDSLDSIERHPVNYELMELMYRLLYLLCDNQQTGFALAHGLATKRGRFWLRHFIKLVSKSSTPRVEVDSDPRFTESLAWVLRGVTVDLRVALSGSLPNVSCEDILPVIFALDSFRDAEGSHIRLLEVLDLFSLDNGSSQIDPPPESLKRIQQIASQESESSLWQLHTQLDGHAFYCLNLAEAKSIFDRKLSKLAYGDNDNVPIESIRKKLEEEWEGIVSWANAWNNSQCELSARVHVLVAWKELVHLSIVDAGGQLLSTVCKDNDDDDLIKQIVNSILKKLNSFPGAPQPLLDPLTAVVVTLVAQLRFECGRHVNMSLPEETLRNSRAVAAATGSYSMSFSTMIGHEEKNAFLRRISVSEYRRILENILDLLCRKGVQDRVPIYATLLLMIHGSRSIFANALVSPYFGSTNLQIPGWVSEKNFLLATDGIGGTGNQTLRNIRSLASSTLDSVYSSSRGVGLLEAAIPDSLESGDISSRLIALSVTMVILECDRDDEWLSVLRRRGVFRHLISFVSDRLRSDALHANDLLLDSLYMTSAALLCTVARTSSGVLALVESGFLARLSESPVFLLCNKRTLSAQVHGEEAAPRRHDLVLPLLRIIVSMFGTLSAEKGNGKVNNNIISFQQACTLFLRTNKRMLSAGLGFPSTSLQDLEETILLLAILRNCASNRFLFIQTLGFSVANDVDQLVFDLLQDLCSQTLTYSANVVPSAAPEIERDRVLVTMPPDMASFVVEAGTKNDGRCSLFRLDVFSQQRRAQQLAVAYLRERRCSFEGTKDGSGETKSVTTVMGSTPMGESSVTALVLCLEYCSNALAGVASACTPELFANAISGKSKLTALTDSWSAGIPHNQPNGDEDFNKDNLWSQSQEYVYWACDSLMYVLENAATALYYQFRALADEDVNVADKEKNREMISKWIRTRLLPNHFGNKEMSALEQFERILRSTKDRSFLQLLMRRMREL